MRSVSEWVGKNDDSMPSEGVRLRIFMAADWTCNVCKVRLVGGAWHLDHILALADGGENRERNLQVICHPCHGAKTRQEATERAIVRRKAKKHHGISKPSRTPLPGGKASKFKRLVGGGVVLRATGGALWPPSSNREELD